MQRIHRTFPATGAMCLAAAVALPGTIANELATPASGLQRSVRMGHAAGAMEIGVEVAQDHGHWQVCSTTTSRTARKIMDGHVYVPASYVDGRGAWFDG